MPNVTGKVQSFEELESKTGSTYWKVKINGKEYTTFKAEVVDGLEEGMTITADVAEQKKGNFTNRYFNSWEQTGEAPRASAKAPQGNPGPTADQWEAKDRRIAMEAAYGSAAKFMYAAATAAKVEAVTAVNFQALARSIYADVIAAGKGSTFQGPKPGSGQVERTPEPPEPDYDPDEGPF